MNKPDKGLKGGSCNLTACQSPGAFHFNKSTKAYYCEDCAREINWPGGRADTMRLYGTPLLCELDEPEASDLPTHVTQPGESLMGIALRELGDESRWVEIRDLNASEYPDMWPHDYYPVGTKLKLPRARTEQGDGQ